MRVLLNPRAGAGAAVRKLGDVRAALQKHGLEHDVVETTAPGDATRLAREAREEGVDVLAVMGGDGTLNEVVQAYVDGEGNALGGPELAVVPAGTGGDYKRTLGLDGSVEDAVSRIENGTTRAHDLGLLRLVGWNREPVTKVFLNITSFGVGGLTDKLVNQAPKWLGGKASFFVGAARALFAYENQEVRIRVDGATFLEGRIYNVAMAIGRFFGGGMMMAPNADPADGLFDVVALGDLSKSEVLALSRHIYDGTHLGRSGITSTRAKLVEAEPIHPRNDVLIDMDGETPGRLPIRASIVPGALRVRC